MIAHLFGALRLYLTTWSAFSSCELQLAEAPTLIHLIENLQKKGQRELIVILNDQKIPQDEFNNTTVHEKDEVVFFRQLRVVELLIALVFFRVW